MLKDLMKSIFSEDVDIEEEEEKVEKKPKEKVSKPIEKKPVQAKVEEAPLDTNSTPSPIKAIEDPILPKSEPVLKDEALQKPQQPSSFGSIQVDHKEKKERKKIKRTDRHDRYRLPVPKTAKPVSYDYQMVVSPIFGNTSDDKKEFDKVHNAVDLEKPAVASSFEQVISPMFGQSIPKVKKRVQPVKEEVVTQQDVIAISDILNKKQKKKASNKQEKLFVSKN